MKFKKFTLMFATVVAMGCSSLFAQELSLSGGADLVSSYVWRGAKGAGASVQPYAELGIGGFAVGVWGSTGVDYTEGAKEVDYYVSYSVGNFAVTLTDYWWEGDALPYFGPGHYYEGALSYTISEKFPLSVSVSTMFGGEGDQDAEGNQLYSTYVALGYPFTVGSVGFDLGVGITPAAGMYADEFGVCSISGRVSKSVPITSEFELPLFVDMIVNPAGDNAFLLFGTSLSF